MEILFIAAIILQVFVTQDAPELLHVLVLVTLIISGVSVIIKSLREDL